MGGTWTWVSGGNGEAALDSHDSSELSGPAGHARHRRRDSTLYLPAATFVAVRTRDTQVEAIVMTPEEYRPRSFSGFERQGLYETEIGRQVEHFGNGFDDE